MRAGAARRFGFITTNSLRQTFNRRVVEQHLNAPKDPLTLAFAVPDHPWVDSAQDAAVRIAMSVGTAGAEEGRLLTLNDEHKTGEDEILVLLVETRGVLHADLRVGANVSSSSGLKANRSISNRGFELGGAGFIITRGQAQLFGLGTAAGLEKHIREYCNGRDLNANSRDVWVIDLFGLEAHEVRARFPAVYQWLLERVKPERDVNRDEKLRSRWWLHRRLREDLRGMLVGLSRFMVTVETSKHRIFQLLDSIVLPDNMLVAIASDDALMLGVLQAYGWQDLGPVPWHDGAAHAAWTETLLQRLVALNARRAAEEATGTVRWLRPDFQDPACRASLAKTAAAAAAAATTEADAPAATPAPQPAHEQTSFEGMAEPPPAAQAPTHPAGTAEEGAASDGTSPPPAATHAWPPS